MRTLRWLFALLIVAFVGIQFVRPEISHPPVTADLQAPPEVKNILRKSCYNCHSNETSLAWFDQIVPAYWLVAHDVKEARQRVNFSEAGKLPAAQQKGLLYFAVNEIRFGEMPLASYRQAHPGSAVTPQELAILRNYLLTLSQPLPPFTPLKQGDSTPQKIALSPNGIAFLPDYKNWKTVNSTDRFDNNTMRQIVGNPVAIQAIADGHINPWPDGTAFAKIAWTEQVDASGIVHPGSFVQVEFMVRDSHKYAATKNWGFARWRGMDLKPYGKNNNFAQECVECHTPLRKNDYVYTMPLRGALAPESVRDQFVTSFIDPRNSTMSTQYKNPAGANTTVTWSQQEDEHWFGAKIPSALKSVEREADLVARPPAPLP